MKHQQTFIVYIIIKIYKTNFSKGRREATNDSIRKIFPNTCYKIWKIQDFNFRNVGSLGFAINYAKHILNKKLVYIFGLDFYEKDYYLKNNHNYKKEIGISEQIKKDWIKLFKYYKDINFHIYVYIYENISCYNML